MFFIRPTVSVQKLGGAVALSLALAIPAHAKDTAKQAAARRALTTIYAKSDRDVMKKDMPAIMSMLAPDFMLHRRDGLVINRAQYQAIAAFGMQNVTNMVVRTKIQRIDWRGPDAIIYSETAARWNQQGASVQSNSTARDYWSLSGGKWQARQVVELTKLIQVNGKPATVVPNSNNTPTEKVIIQ